MALKLVHSEAAKPVPPTDSEFHALVQTDQVSELTELTIGQLINAVGIYKAPGMEYELGLAYTDKPRMASGTKTDTTQKTAFGHAFVLPIRGIDSPRLITSGQFAGYLYEQPEFGDDMELCSKTAAVYVRALDLIHGALAVTIKRNQAIKKAFAHTYTEKYWPENFGALAALPYRAAGVVALRSANLESIDVTQKPRYPVHVAGMMNPLPELGACGDSVGFNVFSNTLLVHSRLRNEP